MRFRYVDDISETIAMQLLIWTQSSARASIAVISQRAHCASMVALPGDAMFSFPLSQLVHTKFMLI